MQSLEGISFQWKVAIIIMIQMPGKSAECAELHRPTSLLSVLWKLFEKYLLPRIFTLMESYRLILDHQFSSRSKHATIELIYRIVKRINNDMEAGIYCTAVFLNIFCRLSRFGIKDYLIKLKTAFQLISKPL